MEKPIDPGDRAELDRYIQALVSLGSDLTLDDFRTHQIRQSKITARRVRYYVIIASVAFMIVAIAVLFSPTYLTSTELSQSEMALAAFWALSLGGLGAAASVFLHVLRLLPQETLRSADEFEVVGRFILGCLFSMILSMTFFAKDIKDFMLALHDINKDFPNGAKMLVPFLAGYSISLVLKLIEKAIRAVELTIGAEDRRTLSTSENSVKIRSRRGRRGSV